jgi:phosphatidylglycerol:prolipoprotein diacylglycerol transferase
MSLDFYQHLPERINPIAFHLGPIEVSWYGIMYLIAFAIVYFLVRYRIKRKETSITLETVRDFFPWAIIGLLFGARLGDVIIYNWPYFSAHPLEIFLPFDVYNHWQYIGIYGMSYFGGLVGLILAFYIFLRLNLKKERFILKKILEFSDLFAPAIPLGYAFGRLGNFINGELYGRITTAPWGMYFPLDITGQLRHPSQLYEMFLEGILLFVILWSIRKSPSNSSFFKGGESGFPLSQRGTKGDFSGRLTDLYLIGYGIARFTAEFFRQPDNDWFFLSLTIGQWMSAGVIILGLIILFLQKKKAAELVPRP